MQPLDLQHGVKKKPPRQEKQTPSKPPSLDEKHNQTTISELFATSKHRLHAEADSGPLSPSKRLKRDPSVYTDDIRPDQPGTIGAESMYTFNSTSPKVNGPIDLTGSPARSAALASPSGGCAPLRRPNNPVQPTSFAPQLGAKKLVVKNLKRTSKISPDQYFNQVWDKLDAALSAIFVCEKNPFSWEELYRGVENICRQEKAPVLFQKLREKCRIYVSATMKPPLIEEGGNRGDITVLREVVRSWSTWSKYLTTIRSIFYYMDRSYLLHSSSQPSIEEMGVIEFRTNIFLDPVLKPKVIQGACSLTALDRSGNFDRFDETLFGDAVEMFHVLGVYTNTFEPELLGQSQTFFEAWAKERSSLPLAEYIDACHDLTEREMSRCDRYKLDHTTKADLTVQLEESLIVEQEEMLTQSQEVSDLIDRNELESLRKLFALLQRKGLGEKLRPLFEAHISKRGSEIVFDEERESEMVVRLLQFKKKLDSIWEFSFQKQEGLGHSLREAFESFINKTKKSSMNWGTDNPKPGEMIAKYVDMILKGGAKAIPTSVASASVLPATTAEEDQEDDEVDEDVHINKQLDQVLDMFRFVHGKAVFEAFYKKDLARRLLMGRSASADAEKSMLTRLKSECGAGFTHNLEQMFKDVELARDVITSYKATKEECQKKSSVDFNVNVLSASAWPTYPDVAVQVPQNIVQETTDFERYYSSKHGNRKLSWKPALAHCQLKAVFPKGNKEIVVSSFQAIVLLLFNRIPENEGLGYNEIQAATSMNDDELKRTLQSLACAKYRVLAKIPKGKEINSTDAFTVNLNFADPKYRIKINQIQLKETREENKETHERVVADRHYETQAAIVRIMKSRKTIKHAELIAEVITATKSRGVLDPADIKKNIEKLIEKDYMEREEGNSYSYLA